MKIMGKSGSNPDHLDIAVGRDIEEEGGDVARILSGMGQCDEFDQHVIVETIARLPGNLGSNPSAAALK